MILVYDGSFEGFLSLVYEVYYQKLKVNKIVREMPRTLLLEDIYEVNTDEQKSLKVLHALQQKFQKEHLESILYMFMCDTKSFEFELLKFVLLGFKSQKELANINRSCVLFIQELTKELFRNYHKMSGFLRFEELQEGTLYAQLEAKYNLSALLGKHFSKRFNNQNYIIHDIKRKLAYIHTQEFQGVRHVESFEIPKHSDEEEKFKRLWREFFETTAIQSRINPKLQQNFVPLLYRVYMSEFEKGHR